MVSFSNAFYAGTDHFKKSKDPFSSVIFGGYNESQIVGGAQGLYFLPLARHKVNPTYFWGVEGWGFAYGNNLIMDPRNYSIPINTVIDSGTTVVLIP